MKKEKKEKKLKLVSSHSPDYMKLKRMIDELNPSEDKEENLLVQQKLTLLYSVLKGRKYTKLQN